MNKVYIMLTLFNRCFHMTTADAAKARLDAEGVSIREWAQMRGYNPRTVYAVLNGQLKCKRGVSHRIAVELGIKPRPQQFHAHSVAAE